VGQGVEFGYAALRAKDFSAYLLGAETESVLALGPAAMEDRFLFRRTRAQEQKDLDPGATTTPQEDQLSWFHGGLEATKALPQAQASTVCWLPVGTAKSKPRVRFKGSPSIEMPESINRRTAKIELRASELLRMWKEKCLRKILSSPTRPWQLTCSEPNFDGSGGGIAPQ
jgi:hypothetical protein